MMTEFKDKVALITGAANGFGKVFAMEAVNRGMKVAIVDIDGDDLFGVTALLKKMGGEVLPIEADVTDYSQVKMSVDKTMETFGQIDVLFANAGIAPSGDIFNLPARDWQWTAYANLISHGWYYSLVLPIMAKQGTACHIIATASIAGILHGIGNNDSSIFISSADKRNARKDILSSTELPPSICPQTFAASPIISRSSAISKMLYANSADCLFFS